MVTIGADIEDITRTIWATLFELPLEPGRRGVTGPGIDRDELRPDRRGVARCASCCRCPLALARTLTAQMFQADRQPDLDEVRDALGELANMLGGNVKALLPAPSRISLPAVAVGSDYELSVVGTSEVATRCPSPATANRCVVTLLQRSPRADAVSELARDRTGAGGTGSDADHPGGRRLDGHAPHPRAHPARPPATA